MFSCHCCYCSTIGFLLFYNCLHFVLHFFHVSTIAFLLNVSVIVFCWYRTVLLFFHHFCYYCYSVAVLSLFSCCNTIFIVLKLSCFRYWVFVLLFYHYFMFVLLLFYACSVIVLCYSTFLFFLFSFVFLFLPLLFLLIVSVIVFFFGSATVFCLFVCLGFYLFFHHFCSTIDSLLFYYCLLFVNGICVVMVISLFLLVLSVCSFRRWLSTHAWCS